MMIEEKINIDFIDNIKDYSREVSRMHNDIDYLCEILNSLDIKKLKEYYTQDKSGPVIDLRKEVIKEIMLGSISAQKLGEIIDRYKEEKGTQMNSWKNPYKILHTIINHRYYHIDSEIENFIDEIKSKIGFEVDSHFVNFDGSNNMGSDSYWLCFYPIGGDKSKSQIFLEIKNGEIRYGVYSHQESRYDVGPFEWANMEDFLNFIDENKDILIKFDDQDEEITQGEDSYWTELTFGHNGEEVTISGGSRIKFWTNMVDWLYKSGYTFPEEYHNTTWRKIYTKSDMEIAISTPSPRGRIYNRSNFHKISDSDKFIMRCSGNSVLRFSKRMLELFGCKLIEKPTKLENVENFTFVDAAKFVLKENNNIPMSAKEIWDEIVRLDLKLNSTGKTPQATLNTSLLHNSSNSNTSHKVKNPIFEVISDGTNKFVLKNYVPKKIKESLIDEGFIHISQLEEILRKYGINI